jgi:transcriptional regulator with XRE-family HTH domain
MKLNEKLKKARIDAGLSIRQAAETLGYKTHSIITKWESGERIPKLESLKKLADAYKVPLQDLLE